MNENLTNFIAELKKDCLSENTIAAYTRAIVCYQSLFDEWTPENLEAFKKFLVNTKRPQTVNQRLLATNKFLRITGLCDTRLKLIKIQNSTFAENVILLQQYNYLKQCLLEKGEMKWYFMVWTMGATGARISELLKIRVEDIHAGYAEVLSKGGKTRRIYFPERLQLEIMSWGMDGGIESGYLFQNSHGNVITARGFSYKLKKFAREFGIDEDVVYPHSFRHMFAKNFLDKNRDLALLADLLGHESIETTQIYLRRTSREQHNIINSVVDW